MEIAPCQKTTFDIVQLQFYLGSIFLLLNILDKKIETGIIALYYNLYRYFKLTKVITLTENQIKLFS